MTPNVKKSSGKMTKKKKQKRTDLHVVKSTEQHQDSPPISRDIWDIVELTDKLKKARKRIKKLENAMTAVTLSRDTLVEKHAALESRVETLDARTSRMGMALRECMKKLEVERPE